MRRATHARALIPPPLTKRIPTCLSLHAQTGKNIDTEEGAARYLEEKGVHPLLEELLTLTLVAKPEHPAAFLAAECKARVDAAASGAPTPSFFTDDDLRGIHSLFDATHSGFITPVQARTALKSLGCDPAGVGSTTAPLDPATWVGIARAGLAKGKGPR
jgi:hypothetical protein